MSYHDLVVMIVIGAGFFALGIIAMLWGRREESTFYGSVSGQRDVREYLERNPTRPEPVAIKYGGRICMAVGAVILLVGLGFYLFGFAR